MAAHIVRTDGEEERRVDSVPRQRVTKVGHAELRPSERVHVDAQANVYHIPQSPD
jgi:hypothetical protein